MTTNVLNDKEIKYDRQLRLWGDHGQRKLEASHVCLLNATATGTEILKSLILPSIGSFTIIDGELVTGADVGCNFFLDRKHIGEPRAKVACQLLRELNEDVEGAFVVESVSLLVQNNLKSLSRFSLVVGTGLTECNVREVAQFLYNLSIPFVVARSYGLFGLIRIQVPEHQIIESHPENEFPDIRLDSPFPTLLEFINGQHLDSMTHQEHSHTPYLILYFKALDLFKSKHGKSFCSSYADKKAFKEILHSLRKPDEKGSLDEENFNEAVTALNKSLISSSVSSDVMKILKDPAANEHFSAKSDRFWIVCNALHKFVMKEGEGKRLPLRGSLPDMISDSIRYVKLQTVFRDQASADAHIVHNYAQETLKSFGLASEMISFEYVKRFCKNAAFLRLLRNRSIEQEYKDKDYLKDLVSNSLKGEQQQMSIYVLFRAVDLFKKELDRYPGANGIPIDLDQADLQKRASRFLQDLGVEEKISTDLLTEMCRFGAAELHGTASVIGGITAQEITKLLTHQYVPLDNTFIFNGITMEGSTFRF